MPSGITRYIFYALVLVLLLSFSCIIFNLVTYRYPGNNYFPEHTSFVALCLMLMYAGFFLQFGRHSRAFMASREILFFYLVMASLALATNAIQYTPYPPIDKQIDMIERSLHIDLTAILSWTHSLPRFQKLLAFVYDTLPYQMAYFPLLLIITQRHHCIREYYFFLLISAIIGFSFYYFYPTAAPASILDSPYFTDAQKATGLKFKQLHQHLQPTTNEGGMVALPSFHTVWAWFCLYLWKDIPMIFIIMLPINLLLITACVLLGWHYPIDILGAVVVVMITHGLLAAAKRQSCIRPTHPLGESAKSVASLFST